MMTTFAENGPRLQKVLARLQTDRYRFILQALLELEDPADLQTLHWKIFEKHSMPKSVIPAYLRPLYTAGFLVGVGEPLPAQHQLKNKVLLQEQLLVTRKMLKAWETLHFMHIMIAAMLSTQPGMAVNVPGQGEVPLASLFTDIVPITFKQLVVVDAVKTYALATEVFEAALSVDAVQKLGYFDREVITDLKGPRQYRITLTSDAAKIAQITEMLELLVKTLVLY